MRMDVFEAVKDRRSIRLYQDTPVARDVLKQILEAARWAPSWANTQCWRFIVVSDAQIKARIAELFSFNRAAGAIVQAPLLIVSCAETGKTGFMQGQKASDKNEWFMFDVASALQNLTLVAHALGLGMVHIGNFDAPQVASLLGVPPGFQVVIMTLLGYPSEVPVPPPRKELHEIVFGEKFGEELEGLRGTGGQQPA